MVRTPVLAAAPCSTPTEPVTEPDFKRAIEDIKLRAPIEEIVRQRVPELRKRGRLYEACCPFHEEKTPSFKVDPSRGTWRCYGACGDGGDVLSFVMQSFGVEFLEAVEILASQTGVEVPRSGRGRRDSDAYDAGFELLKRAASYYRERLGGEEASEARAYLSERGFEADTMRAFGLGWAPASGEAFTEFTRSEGVSFELLEKTGLARRNERGRAYDFFRGRLLFPIRDLRGRTVGFGARRLSDGPNAGPKYINSPESDWFQKGSLIYGLDLAVKEARKTRHLVLVEGYTDVIAAHQKGLANTAAVLGTSTTESHAKLLHRSGARRISLVFDGDNAGREAAYRALYGLLPENYELDVVQPPGGQDPCDILMRDGSEPFRVALEEAADWFEFACDGLGELHGNTLSDAVDRVLALILRVEAPVHREDLVRRLSVLLEMSVETLKVQLAMTPEARAAVRDAEREREREKREGREARAMEEERSAEGGTEEASSEPAAPVRDHPRVRKAWGEIAGALLLDPSLVPLVSELVCRCDPSEGGPAASRSEDIHRVLGTIMELHADLDAEIHEGTVMTALGSDPAREIVGRIVQHAEGADSPKALLEEAVRVLKRTELERERDQLQVRLGAETQDSDQNLLLQRFQAIQEELSTLTQNAGALAPSH